MVCQETISIPTDGRGTYEITRKVREIAEAAAVQTGICNIFVLHTSASLIICENADPAVRRDLETWMQKTVLDGDPDFVHVAEGDDDMPAHVRSILTGNSLTLPVGTGRLLLGTWQGIYLYEHRYHNQQRKVTITIHGE